MQKSELEMRITKTRATIALLKADGHETTDIERELNRLNQRMEKVRMLERELTD